MFTQVKLQTPDGSFVAFVTVSAFQNAPDIVVWGSRFFQARGRLNRPVAWHEPYIEAFAVAVVPIPGIAKNDGTDREQTRP